MRNFSITRAGFPSKRFLVTPGVRILLAPPYSLACFPTFWRSDEISAWGAIHAQPWTRRMPSAAADRENRAKFSVHDFGGSICEPAGILREASTCFGRTPNLNNSAGWSTGCPVLAPAGSVATLKMVTEDVPSGAGRRGFRRPDRT